MKHWWVNHKQTFKSEINGGYVWSPRTNKDGSRNQTYINLTETSPGDVVVSYASAKIQAIGVVSNSWREQSRPDEFGKVGEDSWDREGWAVPINWTRLDISISPKAHMDAIAPLLPEKYSPIRENGNGNQRCYLASISKELGLVILGLAAINEQGTVDLLQDTIVEKQDDQAELSVWNENIDQTEKEQIVKARRGQGRFRSNVERIEDCCRVTGVSNKSMLIASHIKPWRDSTNSERLDGNNGLLLSPHIDKLFDKGWITFLDSGELIFNSQEVEEILGRWGVLVPANVGSFKPSQSAYLEHHRNTVFKKGQESWD